MSPSSIKSWLASLTAPREVVGLTLGKGRMSWCRYERARGVWHNHGREEIALPVLELERSPTAEATASLAEALVQIIPDARQRYLPVQVTLPDPLGYLDTLELEAIPKSSSARRDLVRWHFEKDVHLDGAKFDFECQDLGRDGQSQLLLGQALDASWLAAIRQALEEAGLRAWSINTTFCQRFKAYYDQLSGERAATGLASITADAWSLGFNDEFGRLRFLRSRWRRAGDRFPESVSAEIETVVRAYAHGAEKRQVARLFLAGEAGDCEKLVEILNSRLGQPCIVLPPSGAPECGLAGGTGTGTDDMLPFSTRAA